MLIIGPHMSIAKGFAKTAENVLKMDANTFQFFSRNPRGSNYKSLIQKDIDQFQFLRKSYHFGPIQAHAPYTMNLASPNEDVYTFAKTVIKEDLVRMDVLGIEYFCLHPGNHLGSGVETGIERIITGLNESIQGNEHITILLETMPGKGTEIGFEFSHLKSILEGVHHTHKMGICMDLCHVFSAGYDIKYDLENVLDAFHTTIGLDKLKSIHLNDSMMPFGDRKDRHQVIGKGYIGLDAVMHIMEHPAIKGLPFYIETPLEDEGHKKEIKLLRDSLSYSS